MRDRIAVAALAVYMWAVRGSLGPDRSDVRLASVIVGHTVGWAGERGIAITVTPRSSTEIVVREAHRA